MVEPAHTLRAGWKFIKYQAQFVISEPLRETTIPRDKLRISAMLSFDLHYLYTKKSE